MIPAPTNPASLILIDRTQEHLLRALAECSVKTGVPTSCHPTSRTSITYEYQGYVKRKVKLTIKWFVFRDTDVPQVAVHLAPEEGDDSASDPTTMVLMDGIESDTRRAAERIFHVLIDKLLKEG